MGKRQDWIPRREGMLVELMGVWQVKLSDAAIRADFGWQADDCMAVLGAFAAFREARKLYLDSPTGPNLTGKEEAKAEVVEKMRRFARENIRGNAKMSCAEKQELGLTPSDGGRSPVPVPSRGPKSTAATDPQAPGVVEVRYSGAKPYGVDRIEIGYVISATPVESPDQLLFKETFPRNPWSHTFAGEERGRKLYYALRYLTSKGAGSWSAVREVIVP